MYVMHDIVHPNVLVGRRSCFGLDIRFRPDAIEICCTAVSRWLLSLRVIFLRHKRYICVAVTRTDISLKHEESGLGSRLDSSLTHHVRITNYAIVISRRLLKDCGCTCNELQESMVQRGRNYRNSCTTIARALSVNFFSDDSRLALRCYPKNSIFCLDIHYRIAISMQMQ